jgi:O-antigen/teichoic acid export membrane protein
LECCQEKLAALWLESLKVSATSKEKPTEGLLLDVPAVHRHRIVSGMRWTVWLSAISIPFSYGTAILLARTSPEAIGTYGLLSVYIGVVLGLFYLGGDAVAIKFIPALDSEKRLSFLISYFLIVCLCVVPWLAAAAILPGKLHYLFGEQAGQRFQLLLLILSPLSILASLVGAALKGLLEIAWAQIINRLVTVGSFLVYAILFFILRPLLVHSYAKIIWTTYLVLCALGVLVGLHRLFRLNSWRGVWRSARFFLPEGFWSYTLSLQQFSALSFFSQRLDAILLLNFGNLALLGKYIALITFADSLRQISRFFLDTLLPSLATMVAAQNLAGAADAYRVHMRILFLANACITFGLILLAHPITVLLGAKYEGLTPLVSILALLIGLSTPSSVGNTVLQSIGKQQRSVGVALAQIAIYIALFAFLWPRWQLTGAVLAYGITWLVSNSLYFVIAELSSPFPVTITREYVAFAGTAVITAVLARTTDIGFAFGLVVWIGSVASFLVMARYKLEECKKLMQLFLPFSLTSRA